MTHHCRQLLGTKQTLHMLIMNHKLMVTNQPLTGHHRRQGSSIVLCSDCFLPRSNDVAESVLFPDYGLSSIIYRPKNSVFRTAMYKAQRCRYEICNHIKLLFYN